MELALEAAIIDAAIRAYGDELQSLTVKSVDIHRADRAEDDVVFVEALARLRANAYWVILTIREPESDRSD